MTAKRKKLLEASLAERNEGSEPVIPKIDNSRTQAGPMHGRFRVRKVKHGQDSVLEYQPQP